MSFDTANVFEEMVAASMKIASSSWSAIRTSAEKNLNELLGQTAEIMKSRLSGSLRSNEKQFNRRMEEVKSQTKLYAQLLVAKSVKAVQTAWNALVSILWKSVNSALKSAGLGMLQVPV